MTIKERYQDRIELWNSCFGDSEDYIERFLRAHENRSLFVSGYKDNKLVSGMYIIPAILRVAFEEYDCQYIYAVATLPEERQKGYCSKLFAKLEDNYPDAMLFLVPSDDNIIRYYERMGFVLLHYEINEAHKVLYKKDISLFEAARKNIDCISEKCGRKKEADTAFLACKEKYYRQRDILLEKENCIQWESEELEYILKESSTPSYPPLMVNQNLYRLLRDKGIEDVYFNFAME